MVDEVPTEKFPKGTSKILSADNPEETRKCIANVWKTPVKISNKNTDTLLY